MELLDFLSEYVTDERKNLINEVARKRTRHITVVLDNIFHSHNAAAVLRSCDCFGIQDVHIIEDRYSWDRHPQIERGSARWLNLHRYQGSEHNSVECLEGLIGKGYRIVGTSPHAELSIDEVDISGPTAFVFGAEVRGISDEVYRLSSTTCKIPMYGFTESFNVSVAVALTLHAVRRRLSAHKIAWQLPPEEIDTLREEWIKNSLKHLDKYVRMWEERYRGG